MERTLMKAGVLPRLLPLLLAGPVVLGGCYRGDLTVDVHVVREMQSLIYHLDPEGRLTLREGGGLVAEAERKALYETQLDETAMKALRKVIELSGFLVEDPPIGQGLDPGMFLQIEVKLGMWENRMNIRGKKVESVQKIVTELDKHLPKNYRIGYMSAGVYRPADDVREQW